MRKIFNILIFVFLGLIAINFTFACFTPVGGDENIYLDENSGTNLTMCQGDYYFDDLGTPDGVFHLQGNNYILDCNNSNIFGNQSGSNKGVAFRFTGDDIMLRNCNINNFYIGLKFESSSNNIIENINFLSNSDNDIFLVGDNNSFTDITSVGLMGDFGLYRLEYSNNNSFINVDLNQVNYGFWLLDSNNNNFEDILINQSGSQGFMIESGNYNTLRSITFDQTGSHAIELGGAYTIIDDIDIVSSGYHGINIWESHNIIRNSNLSNCVEYGIKFNPTVSNNTIYNNYFSNNGEAHAFINSQTNNFFNITKTLGTNIIGGTHIGGNYYDNYTGLDITGEGIGNSSYSLGSGVYDYLPLTNNQSVAPASSCLTPTNTGDIFITESTTLCTGTYILEDDYEYMMPGNEGVFILNASDITFDCNGSILDGNSSYFGIVASSMFSNITIKNCNVINYYGGIKLDSDDSTIKDSTFTNIQSAADGTNFGEAIQTGGQNMLIENITITNSNRGLDFGISGTINNSIINTITQTALRISNNDGTIIQNTQLSSSEDGLYLYGGQNVEVINVSISSLDTGIVFQGANDMIIRDCNISNNQNGVYFLGHIELNNKLYNNYFSNNVNYHINMTNVYNNLFNSSKTFGTNIIGGANIGGNYYDDYSGQDLDGDGIGETSYQLIAGIGTVYDYLPLTNNQSDPVSLNKTINVEILNGPNFNEGDIVQFRITYANFTGTPNLNMICPGTIYNDPTISSPHDRSCKIIKDGSYNISFNLTDSEESVIKIVQVNVSNVIPYNLDQVSGINQGVEYMFQLSFDDDGMFDPFNISVNWGDNSSSSIINTYSRLHSIYHNYSNDGNYTINFTVKDDDDFSNVFSFNITLIEDEFNIFNNQTITFGENSVLELFIKNIVSTSDLNISWGDSLNTYNISAQTNGSQYSHNYTSFGNYTINASMIGCKSGALCIGGNTYTATMWVNVIGYGDSIINGVESCDTNNFGGLTCSNYGHNSGSLSCNAGVIDSSSCYTQSSGGGGGSSASNDIEEVIEVINTTSINITNPILNNTLTEDLINMSNFQKINLSGINITLLNKENETLTQDLINESEFLELNITIPLVENETSLFDFIPYIDTIFDFFEIDFDIEEYNFKPRVSLIFTQLKSDIDWSEEVVIEEEIMPSDYDFEPNIYLIFNQFKEDIDWSEELVVQEDLVPYDFKSTLEVVFDSLNLDIERIQ
ncbi:MAG: right-handed parallel beta-helix repeat-containing protein [Candidatus Woesearchaeota archaeon]|jgi:hypothetical protein|nr:right-handed parallel beta-helix repeat-containing protein [Candidatus Woesearchaeota archaeon]